MIKLGIDAPGGSRAAQVVQILETDLEIQTLWYMANRTSKRAAVNDHGPVHVRTARDEPRHVVDVAVPLHGRPVKLKPSEHRRSRSAYETRGVPHGRIAEGSSDRDDR